MGFELDLPTFFGVQDVKSELEKGGSYRFILWDDSPSLAMLLTCANGSETVVCTGTVSSYRIRLFKSLEAIWSTVYRVQPDLQFTPPIPMYPDESYEYAAKQREVLDAYCAQRDQKIAKRFAL